MDAKRYANVHGNTTYKAKKGVCTILTSLKVLIILRMTTFILQHNSFRQAFLSFL